MIISFKKLAFIFTFCLSMSFGTAFSADSQKSEKQVAYKKALKEMQRLSQEGKDSEENFEKIFKKHSISEEEFKKELIQDFSNRYSKLFAEQKVENLKSEAEKINKRFYSANLSLFEGCSTGVVGSLKTLSLGAVKSTLYSLLTGGAVVYETAVLDAKYILRKLGANIDYSEKDPYTNSKDLANTFNDHVGRVIMGHSLSKCEALREQEKSLKEREEVVLGELKKAKTKLEAINNEHSSVSRFLAEHSVEMADPEQKGAESQGK